MVLTSSPVSSLGPIAAKVASLLNKLGIKTIENLLYHLPSRYVDLSNISPIKKLVPGDLSTIKGTVVSIHDIQSKWKRVSITEVLVKDDSGLATCVWFHQRFLSKTIKPGETLLLTGKVELDNKGLRFTHPEYEKILPGKELIHGGRIVPYYPLTQKLTQKTLRFIIKTALEKTALHEWLPPMIRSQAKLPELGPALRVVHFPKDTNERLAAERRLKFDELFTLQMRNALVRKQLTTYNAQPIPFHELETKHYVDSLPFQLTKSQKQASWEIIKDMGGNKPMNRLLSGDVGSGKTVVSSIPILNALLSGFQVAYMTPTELLAEQQFKSFCVLFQKLNIAMGLITSSRQIASRGKAVHEDGRGAFLDLVASGKINFLVGTHSLIQKSVVFEHLALAVVDEQHRFGVSQRQALRQKYNKSSLVSHLLSMTATPIPRTLALTVYGDLDISHISEMPKNRKPIITTFIPQEKRVAMYRHLESEIKDGRQAFIVCPLIDPSDVLGVTSANEELKKMKTVFPNLRIDVLHGRQTMKDKNDVMKRFLEQKADILVSTPVVEVGIDIPNTSMMIIESAERFGLAQLHQLRGRVGRSEHQSYCYLLSDSESEATRKRMQALIMSTNGLALAEIDLELRGPGDPYGIKQSGYENTLYIAKLTDVPIIQDAKKAVDTLLNKDPHLKQNSSVLKRAEALEQRIHPE